MRIHWEPFEVQKLALERPEYEILFGGSRGPGKTSAGMAWMLYDINNPRFSGLVIRRNSDDLSDWIERAKHMYSGTGVTVTGNKPTLFRWPSGATIRTGHLKDDEAYSKYQGHEYQRILIEELTQIPSEDSYLKLISSCRSTVDDLAPQIFCTTNPGGPGHKWVKRRFVSPSVPGTPFKDPISGRGRIFIPAKVTDNPYIMSKDPMYIEYLRSLPEELRLAWLDGSWELAEIKGAYYFKLMRDAEKDGRVVTCKYQTSSLVNTAWDLGLDDSTSIIFFQKVGTMYHVIDYHEENNQSLEYYAKLLAQKGYAYGVHLAPHDIETREYSGSTRKQTASKLGINFVTVPRVRAKEDGIEAVRHMIPNCVFDPIKAELLISCLENYRTEYDDKAEKYKDRPVHDWTSHGADAAQTMALGLMMLRSNNKKKPKRKSYNSECGYGG